MSMQARAGDDPLDRGAAVAGGEGVAQRLLLGVERREGDMGGLGLDHDDMRRARRTSIATPRPVPGPSTVMTPSSGSASGPAIGASSSGADHRDGMSDGAEIVEQGEPVEAEIGGERAPVDPPVAVHEGEDVALDRRGDGERGVARQGAAAVALERRPGRGEPGMLAGPVTLHLAEPRPRARAPARRARSGHGCRRYRPRRSSSGRDGRKVRKFHKFQLPMGGKKAGGRRPRRTSS